MRWFKSGLAVAIIIGMLAFIRWQTDEQTMLIAGAAVVTALVSVFLVMDDSHSVWLAKTRNVPAWGQVVAGIAVLALIGPMVWEALKTAVEAVVGSFDALRCLGSGIAIAVFIILILINRLVRRRRVRIRPVDQPITS